MKTNVIFFKHISLITSQNEKHSRKKIVEKIITHILGSVTFFFENHAVYEKMWGKKKTF